MDLHVYERYITLSLTSNYRERPAAHPYFLFNVNACTMIFMCVQDMRASAAFHYVQIVCAHSENSEVNYGRLEKSPTYCILTLESEMETGIN
jgi:hypothetical protein